MSCHISNIKKKKRDRSHNTPNFSFVFIYFSNTPSLRKDALNLCHDRSVPVLSLVCSCLLLCPCLNQEKGVAENQEHDTQREEEEDNVEKHKIGTQSHG